MKRFSWAMIVTIIASLLAAATAWADKPAKAPAQKPPDTEYPAGVVCPFALREEYIVFRGSETEHFDKLGGSRWIHVSGNIVARYTNLDNGKSVDLNISGPGKITFTFGEADFLVHQSGGGPWGVILLEGDSSPWTTGGRPTALYLKGHVEITYAFPANTLTVDSFNGKAENICDMLLA